MVRIGFSYKMIRIEFHHMIRIEFHQIDIKVYVRYNILNILSDNGKNVSARIERISQVYRL